MIGRTSCLLALCAAALATACGKGAAQPALEPANAQQLAFAAFAPGATDPARKAKLEALAPRLDELFRKNVQETGATAFAASVILDGEIVYERGFGVMELGGTRPVGPDSVFRVGSVTKGFTALAIMKLRDEGKLSLDEPIATYLPEARALRGPTRDSPPVTPRLLLMNASGLAYDDVWGAVTYGQSDAEFSRILAETRLARAPGLEYAYSNLGFALLGKLIERVAGVSYAEYLNANVLRPLGMTSSAWRAEDIPTGRLVASYYRDAGTLRSEAVAFGGPFLPAGGLYTSLHDLSRYVAFHALAYPPRDAPESGPVRRSTLREMHQGQRWMRANDKDAPVVETTDDGLKLFTAAYGFGWFNSTSCTEAGRVSHGGYDQGYFANVTLLPESGIAFAFLTASAGTVHPARAAALALLRREGLLTKAAAPAPPSSVEARAVVEQLLVAWDEALVLRAFDPDSLRFSFNSRLREEFQKLANDHGACRPDGEITTYGLHHADFRFGCERGAIRFDVLTLPGGRLQNVQWTEELAPGPRAAEAATNLLASVTALEETPAGALFAPSLDAARAKKTLRRLALEHGACKLERGHTEIERVPLKPPTTTHRYELSCSERPLVLSFGLDETSGRVTHFTGHPPRPPNATCWE
jgi:CubicO group peptidase (beta-lactamase class C family)